MTTPDVLIGDRYRLVRELGSGGMSVVWEAQDERLNRRVAVKQLRFEPGLGEGEAQTVAERAMREARINARLQHPNAVAVFDVVEHEDRPCLVMELVSARTLADALRESGSHTMPPSQVARIGAQIAAALAAAHGLGIIHRDIKPSNILLGADGRARISDFGISRAVGDGTLTLTGMISGTPAYLAPEVARGEEPTAASDVFSLGATLYAAVEGSPPFGSDANAIALLYRVAEGAIPTPRRAGGLAPLMSRMLADPAARPAMDQVATALTELSSTDLDVVGADGTEASTMAIDPPTGAVRRPGGGVVLGREEPAGDPGGGSSEPPTPVTTVPSGAQRGAAPAQLPPTAELPPTAAPPEAGELVVPAHRGTRRGLATATIAVLLVAVVALAVLLGQRALAPEPPSTPSASQRPTERPAGQDSSKPTPSTDETTRTPAPTTSSTGDAPTSSVRPTVVSAPPTTSTKPAPSKAPATTATPPGKGSGKGNGNGKGSGNGNGNGNGNGKGKGNGKG